MEGHRYVTFIHTDSARHVENTHGSYVATYFRQVIEKIPEPGAVDLVDALERALAASRNIVSMLIPEPAQRRPCLNETCETPFKANLLTDKHSFIFYKDNS